MYLLLSFLNPAILQQNGSEMRNPHERCERKKFVRQAKSASNAKKARTAYADSSSSSDDYPIESSESEGSDECRGDRSGRRGKKVKTPAISSPSEDLSGQYMPTLLYSLSKY